MQAARLLVGRSRCVGRTYASIGQSMIRSETPWLRAARDSRRRAHVIFVFHGHGGSEKIPTGRFISRTSAARGDRGLPAGPEHADTSDRRQRPGWHNFVRRPG